jgi:hypothetical protein
MAETRRKRGSRGHKPRTRNQLIVECWKKLGQPAVGARELTAIQAELNGQLGTSAINSPAAIARVLADEGAELRHPEVIECDAAWRTEQVRDDEQSLSRGRPPAGELLTLAQAAELIEELEQLRVQADVTDTQRIRAPAIEAREAAQRRARSKSLSELQRAEQQEIAEWLGVWIKTPNLFKDWLDLRRRSMEFRRKFSC